MVKSLKNCVGGDRIVVIPELEVRTPPLPPEMRMPFLGAEYIT
jgi:hypothetical protein